jgi:PAS domain S-box-containing protein
LQNEKSQEKKIINILYVDDKPEHIEFAKPLLEKIEPQINIKIEKSPKKALETCLEGEFDCILTDYKMPEMDGLHFAEKVLQLHDIPIILYTGYGSEDVAEDAIRIGISDYIQKDLEISHFHVLLNRIKTVVEGNRRKILIKKSEEKYKQLAENAADILITIDLEGNFTYLSKSFEPKTNYSPKDILGKNISEYLHPESLKKAKDRINKWIDGETNQPPYIVWMRAKNSEYIPFELNTSPIYTENNLAGVQVIARDVTNRLKMEVELRESEKNFKTLAENSPNMILIENDGRILYGNKKCEEILGYNIEELYDPSFNFFQLFSPEAVDEIRGFFSKYPVEKKTTFCESTILTKKGQIIEVMVSTKLIEFAGVNAVLAIIMDITERKRMEKRIIQQNEELESLLKERTKDLINLEEKYRLLFKNMGEGLALYSFVYDEKGKPCDYILNDVNDSFERIIGLSQEEALGQKGSKIYRINPPPYLDLFTKMEETGSPMRFELYCPILQKHLDISTFLTGKGSFATVFSDITEKKKLREDLISNERIAAAGQLASTVGHDLRGPLQIIKNAVYYLKKRPEKYIDSLKMIEEATERALVMLEELRVKMRIVPVEMKNTDLNRLINDVVSEMGVPDLINLEILVGEGLESINIDPLKIRRVLENLIKNALEATYMGGSILIEAEKKDDIMEIKISDTGVGIPEDFKQNLFKPFHSSKPTGLGIGLVYCKNIVEQHGGTINAKSTVGKGSTFTVRIPVKER